MYVNAVDLNGFTRHQRKGLAVNASTVGGVMYYG